MPPLQCERGAFVENPQVRGGVGTKVGTGLLRARAHDPMTGSRLMESGLNLHVISYTVTFFMHEHTGAKWAKNAAVSSGKLAQVWALLLGMQPSDTHRVVVSLPLLAAASHPCPVIIQQHCKFRPTTLRLASPPPSSCSLLAPQVNGAAACGWIRAG